MGFGSSRWMFWVVAALLVVGALCLAGWILVWTLALSD
jgi:hypothetical protein